MNYPMKIYNIDYDKVNDVLYIRRTYDFKVINHKELDADVYLMFGTLPFPLGLKVIFASEMTLERWKLYYNDVGIDMLYNEVVQWIHSRTT